MAETFYFTRDNGTPGGCKVMSAQFIKLDVHEWGSTYTKTAHTERLVKDCRTEAEAVEVFRQLPLPVKLS